MDMYRSPSFCAAHWPYEDFILQYTKPRGGGGSSFSMSLALLCFMSKVLKDLLSMPEREGEREG
jgi:hypothetical protein